MDGLQRNTPLKWMIWGYPHFRKPQFMNMLISCYGHAQKHVETCRNMWKHVETCRNIIPFRAIHPQHQACTLQVDIFPVCRLQRIAMLLAFVQSSAQGVIVFTAFTCQESLFQMF